MWRALCLYLLYTVTQGVLFQRYFSIIGGSYTSHTHTFTLRKTIHKAGERLTSFVWRENGRMKNVRKSVLIRNRKVRMLALCKRSFAWWSCSTYSTIYIISKVNRIDEDSFCCRYQYSEWNSFGCAFFVLSSTIIIPSWFPIESFNRIFYLPSVSIKGHLKVFMWEINSTEEARILNRAPCTLYLNICCRNCGEKLQNVRLHNHVQL